MRTLVIVGVAVLVAAALVLPILAADPPKPAANPAETTTQPRPAPMRPGPGAGDQWMQQVFERLQLTPTEQTATRTAINQKMQAMQTLRQQMQELRTAVQGSVTDAQAKQALDRYRRYQREYEQRVAAIDQDLAKKLSARSQARLVALGVMDNGLGFGMGRMGMRRGPGGPGAFGGRPRMGSRAPRPAGN